MEVERAKQRIIYSGKLCRRFHCFAATSSRGFLSRKKAKLCLSFEVPDSPT